MNGMIGSTVHALSLAGEVPGQTSEPKKTSLLNSSIHFPKQQVPISQQSSNLFYWILLMNCNQWETWYTLVYDSSKKIRI